MRKLPIGVLLISVCVLVTVSIYVAISPCKRGFASTRMCLGISKREYKALIAIYNGTGPWQYNGSTKNVNWLHVQEINNGWPIHDGKPCTWFGVECENGHVASLNLALHGLSGDIPGEIGDLRYLEELDLSYNDFIRNLPPEIGRLANLRKLVINNNHMLGSLPTEIGDLESLEELYAFFTSLRELPPEIGKLTNLRCLALHNNELTRLPVEITQLEQLEWITLVNNPFSKAPEGLDKIRKSGWCNDE